MLVVGLTGSIGMGKSTTARMFADAGIPVHDADAAVHRLYAGEAAPLVEAAFPGTVSDGVVDRKRLGAMVIGDPNALARLEAIVHPLVRDAEREFLAEAENRRAPLVILDIPLLFETGAQDRVDFVVVVTAPADVQRERVMSRAAMTEEQLDGILAKQTPDAEKRARADFVIDTSLGMECARAKVDDIIRVLSSVGNGRNDDVSLDDGSAPL